MLFILLKKVDWLRKMKKLHLNSYCIHDYFNAHDSIKDSILSCIEQSKHTSSNTVDSYHSDSVDKLDWNYSKDFDREWVKVLMPHLSIKMDEIANNCGYQSCQFNEIWFQQYTQSNTHGWHTHGHNFTCVYYIELPKDSPKTELIDPFLHSSKIVPDIKEGDILVFPSYVIHRAPIVVQSIRKTIISFNVNFNHINIKTLAKLNNI